MRPVQLPLLLSTAPATPPLYCSCFFGARECLQRLQNSDPVASNTLFSILCLPHNYLESRWVGWRGGG